MSIPRVSIGLPVYNGENYLEQALDCLLAQTFGDFELIISDNASPDKTEEICRVYTARDQRIRYYRNGTNLGAAWNYNHVFELSHGEYFKWAAHDDRCAPEFLKRCIEILDRDPSVVLCYPKAKIIDEQGRVQRNYDIKLNTDSSKPHVRFHEVICVRHGCYQVFGLIRASALKRTPLIRTFYASDRNLLAELSLIGRFYEIPEYLFFRRNHSQTSTRAFSIREVVRWYDPAATGKMRFPHWRNGLEYILSVKRVRVRPYDRFLCYLSVGSWFVRRRSWLVDDLEQVAMRILDRLPRVIKLIVRAFWRSIKVIDPALDSKRR
jgi:glycosyltransferase involved in cell wall biosynthesis